MRNKMLRILEVSNRTGGRRSFVAGITLMVLTVVIAAPTEASNLAHGDSVAFTLDTHLSRPVLDSSAGFNLTTTPMARVWGDSGTFSLSWPQPELTLFAAPEDSVVQGESFDVYATLRNVGTNGDHGGIAISFPELIVPDGAFPYGSDRASVTIAADTEAPFSIVQYYSSGDLIETATGMDTAGHLLFQAEEPEWEPQEEHGLRLTVTPHEPGPLTIRARSWIAAEGDGGYGPPVLRDPVGGDEGVELDQQGYWSEVLTVDVVESAAASDMRIDRWWAFTAETITVEIAATITEEDEYRLNIEVEGLVNSWRLSTDAVAIVDAELTEHDFDDILGTAQLGRLSVGQHVIRVVSLVAPSTEIIEHIGFSLEQNTFWGWREIARFDQMFVADRRGLTEEDVNSNLFQFPDGTTIGIASVQQLVDTFAPMFFFDGQENYLPQSVQATLAEHGCGEQVVLRSAGGAELLTDPGTSGLLAMTRAYGSDAGLDNLWLDLPCAAPTNGMHGTESFPVYATAVLDVNTIGISYYVHYGYSNWRQRGGYNDHEGDWESAFVYLSRDTASKPFSPVRVAYSQHEKYDPSPKARNVLSGGEWASWDDLESANLLEFGTHPRLYVGRGGHASYFAPEPHYYWIPCPGPFGRLYTEEADGDGLGTLPERVVYLPRVPEANSNGMSWLIFPGHWGQDNLYEYWGCPRGWQGDSGPLGPVFSTARLLGAQPGERWFDPIGWPDEGFAFTRWRPEGTISLLGTWDVSCSSNGVCDDGNPCTEDVCTAGVCHHHYEPVATPCGDQSTGECDNPDICDGYGVCVLNYEPDGTPCSTDGFECTGDVCESGSCVHPDAAAGVACGDQSTTFCQNPDGCDGYGNCLPGADPCPDQWCDFLEEVCVAYGNGDFDVDLDVDLWDFALFQQCFGDVATDVCFPANFVGENGMIDLADFVGFESAFTGP